MIKQIDCPVCGHKVEVFDICDHCGWQNSGLFEDEQQDQQIESKKIEMTEEDLRKRLGAIFMFRKLK